MTKQKVELREFLFVWRERMSDPDRIVRNPYEMFENEAGTPTFRELAVRACFLGHRYLAAADLELGPHDEVPMEALRLVFRHLTGCSTFTECLVDRGHQGCVRVLDSAIGSL